MNPLRLKELLPPTGGPWGSIYVDGEFIRWCEVFFGKESFAQIRHTSPFYSLLEQWEEAKTSFGGDGGRVRLNMVGVPRHQGIDVNKMQVICAASSDVREHAS